MAKEPSAKNRKLGEDLRTNMGERASSDIFKRKGTLFQMLHEDSKVLSSNKHFGLYLFLRRNEAPEIPRQLDELYGEVLEELLTLRNTGE